ncbi:hypothetical protein DSC45_02620 [Streptomyces sp. YIM 130001]|uniref:hypothetical protein n=1 Tax=Streptomyces sp. YIM 130001 TaxID=2259644 RepID=UPI000E647135|nr:hypothetical protein [Streptomyces sp. YIM 130001]RII20714.1 hypothetical protein DSC45_02620 [Streptomyces sp. YIM 130001]
MTKRRAIAACSLVLALVGGWVAGAEWPVETPETTNDWDGPVELADGRRVLVKFTAQGLVERHQSDKGAPWSRPRVLSPVKGDDDCGVHLSTYRNTVAVIAHWDHGCYGEAARKSIAAVSDGDLDEWDTHVTEHEDDWKRTRFSWIGNRVVFRKEMDPGVAELSWRQTIGFTGPTTKSYEP